MVSSHRLSRLRHRRAWRSRLGLGSSCVLFFSRHPGLARRVLLLMSSGDRDKARVHPSCGGMRGYAASLCRPALTSRSWSGGVTRLSSGLRRAALVAVVVLACGVFTFLRRRHPGDADSDLHCVGPRLQKTASAKKPTVCRAHVASGSSDGGADWSGFRGAVSRRRRSRSADQDRLVSGAAERDMASSDWRAVSFAVRGDSLYKQSSAVRTRSSPATH